MMGRMNASRSPTRLPHRFGGYLMTSSLGTDALGSVYRALVLGGDAFVRLRLFDSPEIVPGPVAAMLMKHASPALSGPGIVEDPRCGVADGIPYLAWSESHAHGLDRVSSALAMAERRMPPGHALFVAERIALALEQARVADSATGESGHGLVWPGFVVIGRSGDVRLGGFGVAGAILPYLSRPVLEARIAPYVAPEVREGRADGERADVYAVAAILFELLTGSRPPLESAPDAVPSLPRGVGDALRAGLAPSARRATIRQLRLQLGQCFVVNGFSPSSRALAIFLGDLLGRDRDETREETVPVVTVEEEEEWERALARLEPSAEPLPQASARSRGGPKSRVPIPGGTSPARTRPGDDPAR